VYYDLTPAKSAEQLAKSGCYDGATAGQLLPRIIAGRALGLDDTTSCSCIACSRGKLTYTASLLSGQLARSTVYGYEVEEHTDERCVVHVTKLGKRIGTVGYTLKEAERARLTSKDVWKFYPSDLLFARCLTRAVRRFAPDLVLGNAALTVEEVGADVHEKVVVPDQQPAATPAPVSTPTAPAPTAKPGVTKQQLDDIKCAVDLLEIPQPKWKEIIAKRGVQSARDLSEEQAAELLLKLNNLITAKILEDGMSQRSTEAAAHTNDDLTVDTPIVGRKEVAAAGPNGKSS
jgi:hypothetical protein